MSNKKIEKENLINQEIKKTLDLLDVQEIEVPTYLFTKIKSKINPKQKTIYSYLQSYSITMFTVVIVGINISSAFIFLGNSSNNKYRSQSYIGSLTEQYYILSEDDDILTNLKED